MRALLLAALLFPSLSFATERFALVLGSNQGTAGQPPLWYAQRDATRFSQALVELGGFNRENVVVLHDPQPHRVRASLEAMEGRVRKAKDGGSRALLVVYFSGHANRSGLELGGDLFTYDDFRRRLTESSADTRVAVVDACHSGALTQNKGARAAPDLDFPLPVEDRVEGLVLIASTSAGELAQESSELQGSFFTSHFEAALRGAGDLDGDEQVTLSEAFRYTSARTISATAETRTGPQHPTYDTRMSGRADVVLADLRRAEATLILPASKGSLFVVRNTKGHVSEILGGAAPVRPALAAGHYGLERRSATRREKVEVRLAKGDVLPLPPMKEATFLASNAKGGAPSFEALGAVGVGAGFLPRAGGVFSGRLGLAAPIGPLRLRLQGSLNGQSVADRGFLYDMTTVGGALAVLWPLGPDDGFRLDLGAQLGLGWATQKKEAGAPHTAWIGSGDVLLLGSYPVGFVRLGTEVTLGANRFRLNGVDVFRMNAAGSVLVLLPF